jgi:ferric-dicitrate binding protein FerR (iron transport regulator)
MDFIEKARNRLEHWITHNDHHQEAYEMFVEQLKEAGKIESSEHVREMVELTAKSTECLRKAINSLE